MEGDSDGTQAASGGNLAGTGRHSDLWHRQGRQEPHVPGKAGLPGLLGQGLPAAGGGQDTGREEGPGVHGRVSGE